MKRHWLPLDLFVSHFLYTHPLVGTKRSVVAKEEDSTEKEIEKDKGRLRERGSRQLTDIIIETYYR